MKIKRPHSNVRGALTVISLVIVGLGTIGMLGLISIMQARMTQLDSAEEAALRRVREMNGRQLAKAFSYRRVWTTSSGTSTTVELPGQWGRITASAWNEAAFDTNSKAASSSPWSIAAEAIPFMTSVNYSVFGHHDGTQWLTTSTTPARAPKTVQVQVRSIELPQAGIIFDSRPQNASKTISGDLRVYGKSLIWNSGPASNHAVTHSTQEYVADNRSLTQAATAPTEISSANAIKPKNFPVPEMPNWFAEASNPVNPNAYPTHFGADWGPFAQSGTFNNMWSALNNRHGGSPNTLNATSGSAENVAGASSDGAGNVTIVLDDLNLTDTVIVGATTINFTGQTTAAELLAVENLPPITILSSSNTVANVSFTGANARPLIFLISSDDTSGPGVMSFADGADYRMHLVADKKALSFQVGGAATIRGSIATDHDVAVSVGDTIHLRPETTNPAAFEGLLWRSFWVESYQQ